MSPVLKLLPRSSGTPWPGLLTGAMLQLPEDDTYTDPDPFAQFGYQTSSFVTCTSSAP